MTLQKFLKRNGIIRHTIKKDILYFALPAIVVWFVGLVVTAIDGYEGMVVSIGKLITQPQNISLQNISGLILIFGGLTIMIVAHFTIKRFHSPTLVIKEGHQLITHGIYHIVRHPIYFGGCMVVIGVPVYGSSLKGLLVMIILILIVLNRIRMEEDLLINEFGEAYKVYKQTTKKLIPFIY